MAKGAAMMGPNMATMLALVMTDAPLDPPDGPGGAPRRRRRQLQLHERRRPHEHQRHRAAGGQRRGRRARRWPATTWPSSAARSTRSASSWPRRSPATAKGATHLVTIEIAGCADRAAALAIAKTVANSPLVKTAIHGADPNWGRIVSAAGYAGVPFDPRRRDAAPERLPALSRRHAGGLRRRGRLALDPRQPRHAHPAAVSARARPASASGPPT